MTLAGGCFCRAVRYEAAGTPFGRTVCHCSICRRTTGAPFVAWFSVRRSDFHFVQGTPQRFASTPTGTRTFCPRCGTQLTFERADLAEEIDVTTCSLDDPGQLPPRDHTWAGSRIGWVETLERLPQYAEARKDG